MLISQMRGLEATVRWGYRTAAVLGPWTYESAGHTLTAPIVEQDAFCLEQTPLVLHAPMGRAVWRWAVTSLQINGSTLTARVAEQEG